MKRLVQRFWRWVRGLFARNGARVVHPTAGIEYQEVRTAWKPGARFVVRRHHEHATYEVYAGDHGGEARRAWESYQAANLPGEFSFHDGPDVRGRFTR